MGEQMKVFVTRKLPGNAIERLSAGMDIDLRDETVPVSGEELRERIRDKAALLCLLTDHIDEGLMDIAPGLKIISNYAVGYDNIDMAAARKRHIVVTNTPGVLNDATADLTWALLFAAARRIVEADAFLRSSSWQGWDPSCMLGANIFGQCLGVIGAGRIGTAVALRAAGFNMKVLYADAFKNEVLEQRVGARRVEMDALLGQADFVSLHVPLGPDTCHLIGRSAFKRMKPSAVLVNTSRGAIIDEAALAEALVAGEIAGAGLDVFEHEPAVFPGLLEAPNTVLVPHIASATWSTRAKMADMAVDSLLAFSRGQTPDHIVE